MSGVTKLPQAAAPDSRFRAHEVSAAGHFWAEGITGTRASQLCILSNERSYLESEYKRCLSFQRLSSGLLACLVPLCAFEPPHPLCLSPSAIAVRSLLAPELGIVASTWSNPAELRTVRPRFCDTWRLFRANQRRLSIRHQFHLSDIAIGQREWSDGGANLLWDLAAADI